MQRWELGGQRGSLTRALAGEVRWSRVQRARQEEGREGLRTSPWAWRLWASLTGPSREKAAGLGAGEGAGQEPSVLARLGFLAQALWADHTAAGKPRGFA